MSLLLDARKKSQQAQSAHSTVADQPEFELSLEEYPHTAAADTPSTSSSEAGTREAEKNLFQAKSTLTPRLPGVNRPLLLALAGTVLLSAAGAAYWRYLSTFNSSTPLRPISAPPPASGMPISTAVQSHNPLPAPGNSPSSGAPQPARPALANSAETSAVTHSTPHIAGAKHAEPALKPAQDTPSAAAQQNQRINLRHNSYELLLERAPTEQLDPLLNNAYLAYSEGRLEEAHKLYLAMHKKEALNIDALLGLAAIAQQNGDPQTAVQYYLKVLKLDPRNAFANAGMSALSNDVENSESLLKSLLREQDNSAALHFALGNLYAGQARWSEAQQSYFNAYTLEPDSAEFAYNLAVSLDHLGQGKLAAQHYLHALQIDQSRSAGFNHELISRRVQELAR